jgi:hypothetical protein
VASLILTVTLLERDALWAFLFIILWVVYRVWHSKRIKALFSGGREEILQNVDGDTYGIGAYTSGGNEVVVQSTEKRQTLEQMNLHDVLQPEDFGELRAIVEEGLVLSNTTEPSDLSRSFSNGHTATPKDAKTLHNEISGRAAALLGIKAKSRQNGIPQKRTNRSQNDLEESVGDDNVNEIALEMHTNPVHSSSDAQGNDQFDVQSAHNSSDAQDKDKFDSRGMHGSLRLSFDPRNPQKLTKWTRFFAVGWYDYDTPLIDIYHNEKQHKKSANIVGDPLYLRDCKVGLISRETILKSLPYHSKDTSARGHVFTAVKSLLRKKEGRERQWEEDEDAAAHNIHKHNVFHDMDDEDLIQNATPTAIQSSPRSPACSNSKEDEEYFGLEIILAPGTDSEQALRMLFDSKSDMAKWVVFITTASSMQIPTTYIVDLVNLMLAELESKFGNNSYFPFGSTYEHSVKGSDLLDWVVTHKWCNSSNHGKEILQQMINKGCLVQCEKSVQLHKVASISSTDSISPSEQFAVGIIYRVVEIVDVRKKASGYLREGGNSKLYTKRFFFFKGADMFFWQRKEHFDKKRPPLRNHPINLRGYQIELTSSLGFKLVPGQRGAGISTRVWEFQAECVEDKNDWVANLSTILNEEMDEHIC